MDTQKNPLDEMVLLRNQNICLLEDLKRSPVLLNNVRIGQCQHKLIIQTYMYFVLPYMGMVAFFVKYHIYIVLSTEYSI